MLVLLGAALVCSIKAIHDSDWFEKHKQILMER
jgi:hypothetical protein